jgi:tetratricopeptide (TPR) repeat protein
MNRINFLLIIIYSLSTGAFAQTSTHKYGDVDTLLSSANYEDKLDALTLLESKYGNDSSESNYWVKHSIASFNTFNYINAIQSINRAISINHSNSYAYFEKARMVMELEKDMTKAIRLLDTAIQYENKGRYHFYRGIYYQMSDNPVNAINDYDTATKLKFVHQGLYRNYSILLLKSNQYEKALAMINNAIGLNPRIPENYNSRGEIYIFLAEPDKACAEFEKASFMGYHKFNDLRKVICLENQELNKLSVTGDVMFQMGKYKAAIKAYGKAIEGSKDTSRYYLNRGYCYYQLGIYDKAEEDYFKALSAMNPSIDMLYNNLSLLYYDQNEFEKSIEYSNKRIDLNPLNHVPYIDRGLCFRKLKKYKLAEDDFNRSLEIKPDFFRAFGYRSFLFLELGQHQKAFEDASKSVEINPKYGYGYLVLGQTKQKLQLPDFCLDFYKAKKYGNKDVGKTISKYCE